MDKQFRKHNIELLITDGFNPVPLRILESRDYGVGIKRCLSLQLEQGVESKNNTFSYCVFGDEQVNRFLASMGVTNIDEFGGEVIGWIRRVHDRSYMGGAELVEIYPVSR